MSSTSQGKPTRRMILMRHADSENPPNVRGLVHGSVSMHGMMHTRTRMLHAWDACRLFREC